MTTDTSQQTLQALQNHIAAFGRGDVDAIMADYAEDAVFYTPDGALRGKAAFRPLFEDLVAKFPPGSSVELKQQIIDRDLAYIVWSGESDQLRIRFATDTLLVRDGKIHRQTFAAQMESKSDS